MRRFFASLIDGGKGTDRMDKTDEISKRNIQKFKSEILPPLVSLFESIKDELSNSPLNVFSAAATELLKTAFSKFLTTTGVEKYEDLDTDTIGSVIFLAVSGFNSALPLNYPYLVGVLMVKNENSTRFICLRRSSIPGIHDCLNKNMVPIIKLDTLAEAASGKLNVKKMEFINPDSEEDNLEEMFKKE